MPNYEYQIATENSEMAIKFEEIFNLFLSLLSSFFKIFVGFSENLNFNLIQKDLGHKMAWGTCRDISAFYEAIFLKFWQSYVKLLRRV